MQFEDQSCRYRQIDTDYWLEKITTFIFLFSVSAPITEEWVSLGGKALLPCNITAPPGDSPQLIIFYKGLDPIYSVDARAGTLEGAVHWVSPQIEQRHPRFEIKEADQGLILLKVKEKDEDEYYCRVDFHESPTRNVRIRLNVAAPPSELTIRSEAGLEVKSVIGPYPLGADLRLTCQADGGRPSPHVKWYNDNQLIDDVMEAESEESVSNTLSIPNLSRKHLFMDLTCRASTRNLTKDVISTVKLDLTFPPSDIRILGAENNLRAGWTHDFTCEVWGSRPAPAITWWKDGRLVPTTHQLMVEGNVSRSRLEIIPSKGDNGAVFSCQAVNENLSSGGVIEQAKRIKVEYPPEVSLRAGPGIKLDNIKEGDDVYFECSVESYPSAYRFTWFRDAEELNHNISEGIIRSNLSLVLQKVTRFSSGNYICVASNTVASSSSNKLLLDVKYRPVCSPGQKLTYGGGKQEAVQISCNVDALPIATSFHWSFNTSTELVDLPQRRSKTSEGKSMVTYMPQTHLDFGSLLCWGINDVGKQDVPCVFQVVPAGPPELPKNCSAWHEVGAAGEMMVACQPGADGGLPQRFSLEIAKQLDGILLLALRDRPYPKFTVTSLNPGTEYLLRVVASNSQGASHPVVFTYFTPIDIAEERMSASAAGGSSEGLGAESLIAIICGVAAAIVLTCGILIVVVRIKMGRSRSNNSKVTRVSDDQFHDTFTDESNQSIITNPDLIMASDELIATPIKVTKKSNKEKHVSLVLENEPSSHQPRVLLMPLSLSSAAPSFPSKGVAPPHQYQSHTGLYAPHLSSSMKPSSATGNVATTRFSKPPNPCSPQSSYPFHTSPCSEMQPLLLVPPLPPPSSSFKGSDRAAIEGGAEVPLNLPEGLSPPEEFASKETNWKKEETYSQNIESPQKESVV